MRCDLLQPQWLFHALIRVMQPTFKAIRYGRRYGEDPREDMLSFDAAKEAKAAAEKHEREHGLVAARFGNKLREKGDMFAVRDTRAAETICF